MHTKTDFVHNKSFMQINFSAHLIASVPIADIKGNQTF